MMGLMQSEPLSFTAEQCQLERIPTIVFSNATEAALRIAEEIRSLIESKRKAGQFTVLGLATGSTPVAVYRHLIRLHREEGLSFRDVITFNLDEYYGLGPDHPESYATFMREQLFAHIDIDPTNTHVPDGLVPRDQVYAWCREYERKIEESGGIDYQILGIGRTGHIGFNEPGSTRESRTRLIYLDHLTRQDAARDFRGESNVPLHAITMGIQTILQARQIRLLAWGEAKARVVARAVEEPPSETIPASLLQGHPQLQCLLDVSAASYLTRFRHPWKVGPVDWDARTIRRAVQWLSKTVKKPLLKLVQADYSEHGLAELVLQEGPAYNLNIRLFNQFQHTITGWPGGKPQADDSNRPERALPYPKRVAVLSPEPLDVFPGMGGTLHRLLQQGHAVRLYFLTSGNLAVPDSQARRALQWALELEESGHPPAPWHDHSRRLLQELENKLPSATDGWELRKVKGALRRSEVRSAAELLGLPSTELRFLDLPFYENGRYRQFQPGPTDRAILLEELRKYQPQQIFATGSKDDPASVPGVCWSILREILPSLLSEEWARDCRLWLYRGSGVEWEPHLIDMAVPLSPDERTMKSRCIYCHQSQLSQTPIHDPRHREIWQQSEASNHDLAVEYDQLGLAEYEALEGFVRGHFS